MPGPSFTSTPVTFVRSDANVTVSRRPWDEDLGNMLVVSIRDARSSEICRILIEPEMAYDLGLELRDVSSTFTLTEA